MSRFRVCFLGTPHFAELHLRALLRHPEFEVVGVVTQPDRPAGRKMQMTPSAVKTAALENHLPVLTPENLKKEILVAEEIKKWNSDVAVVVAFGQILSQEFLDSFKFGAVNIHGSLLPKWRGAAPIQRSLAAGDKVSGVSLQKMVRKLDAGPIIGERKILLDDEINATEVYDVLAVKGCELLSEDLPKYLKNEISPVPQDESLVTFAAKIEKSESYVDWKESAEKIHNKIRGFSMGPGTYTDFQGKRLKIHKSKVVAGTSQFSAGFISELTAETLVIQCGENSLSLLEVQPESKSKQTVKDFLKSQQLKKGEKFE